MATVATTTMMMNLGAEALMLARAATADGGSDGGSKGTQQSTKSGSGRNGSGGDDSDNGDGDDGNIDSDTTIKLKRDWKKQ